MLCSVYNRPQYPTIFIDFFVMKIENTHDNKSLRHMLKIYIKKLCIPGIAINHISIVNILLNLPHDVFMGITTTCKYMKW